MVNEKKLEALKQYLQQCVEEGIFPGCNCAVITKDDKWTCSVGYKPVSYTHLYRPKTNSGSGN